ncbi:FmdB family zinc ribbon protein [Rhodococcus opacus]|uniref:FmdB family zinc ribbon protein n=1 Tax=Rhodococcus opacus TaxID=37919 RepID=UPI001C45079F|nr:zinc ribbon domain-containing protein [Rhodococcus opacus]
MPIYEYRCVCGVRLELLMRFDEANPSCPSCRGETVKMPSRITLGGRATAGLAMSDLPQTWRGTHGANAEYVTELRKQWDGRQRLEEKHPELRDDRRPVIAHEGPYRHSPLRVGDPVPGKGDDRSDV